MTERFQIFQLTVPTVPVGGIVGVPLTLDSDAPFFMRAVKSRNIPATSGFRFQDPLKLYQSNANITDRTVDTSGAGFGGSYATRGRPFYPGYVYPPGGQIVCDIGNDTGEEITNARLVFYGAKLFKDSAYPAPQYPAKFATLPFTYPQTDGNGQPAGPISVPLATSATQPAVLIDRQMRVAQDGDFAVRYMVADPFYLAQDGGRVPPGVNVLNPVSYNYQEIYVLLKDESRKAYMNEPVHINDVFGQGLPFSTTGSLVDNNDQGTGPVFPGLWRPEIIVPRQHSLYFDIYRYDTVLSNGLAAIGPNTPIDLWFRFSGVKVMLP